MEDIKNKLFLSLYPENIVWMNKKHFFDINVYCINRMNKGDRHMSKESYVYHLLPRLTNKISNAHNNDMAWRP
tara:strand:- start:396 stop:614 length:219 start_codon:yes stop_codon:yes gene_type:complete